MIISNLSKNLTFNGAHDKKLNILNKYYISNELVLIAVKFGLFIIIFKNSKEDNDCI